MQQQSHLPSWWVILLDGSGVNREVHAPFCERPEVKFLRPTRQLKKLFFMKKLTASEALYAMISRKGMVLIPKILKTFLILDVFLHPRWAS